MKDNRDSGHSPRIPTRKKRGSTRKGGEKYGEKISKTGAHWKGICGCGKRKKMIEIEKKRQTSPII